MVHRGWSILLAPLALLAAVAGLSAALPQLQTDHREESRQLLEDAVRRSAVACYAAEGVYPPTLTYLEERYGLQIDTARYTVFYDVFAENLMPDITVLENEA